MAWRPSSRIIAAIVVSSVISAAIAYHFGARKDFNRAGYQSDGASAAENAPCVRYTEASDLVGKPACVTGRVLKVYTSRAGNTFLDFCEDYRSCPFTSVIFSEDRAKFGDLATLQGQVVEIRGLVTYYKDRPEIIIRGPKQLKLRE